MKPYSILSLWTVMIEIDGHRFLEVHRLLSGTLNNLGSKVQEGAWGVVPVSYQELCTAVDFFQQHAKSVGLPLTLKSATALKAAIQQFKKIEQGYVIQGDGLLELQRHLNEVVRRSSDEYSTRVMLALPYVASRYYEEGEGYFGDAVTSKFPSAVYEMDEACKCFALHRFSAVVFHLMRLMEIAVNSTRLCLNIPDPVKPAQRNWGFILKAFRDEIDRRSAQQLWKAGSDRYFFEEVGTSINPLD